MEQLTASDSQMLYIETSESPNHIAPLMIYDPSTAPGGVVTHKGILANLQSRLHLAPAFRKKLVRVPFDIDEPYWVDDPNFDLEFHVRHLALPKPGDWRQLCIVTSRLISRPLDPARPMWEMNIIEGLDNIEGFPPGCFAILLKIHHSMVDGKAGVAIINALHDLEPLAVPTHMPEDSWRPERQPEPWKLARTGIRRLSTKPTHFARVLARQIPGMFAKNKPTKQKAPLRVPNTPLNGPLTPHRVVDARTFSLQDIKLIRQLVPGSTVNDVVIAVVSGGLHKYLKSKNKLPKDPLVAAVPISTRDKNAAKTQTQGNALIVQNIILATDIAHAIERLKAVCETMDETKAYVEAVGAKNLSEVAAALPGSVAGLLARTMTKVGEMSGDTMLMNTIITNVPGVQVPIYMSGAKCIFQGGGGPLNGQVGVIHLVGSYCGNLTFNYTACRDLLPDPDFYTQCLVDSFDELMAETGHARRTSLLNAEKKQAEPKTSPRSTAPKKAAKRAAVKKVPVKKASVKKSSVKKSVPKKRIVKRAVKSK